MLKTNFMFNVLVTGYQEDKAKQILDERLGKLAEDKLILGEPTIEVKPLEFFKELPKNKEMLEEFYAMQKKDKKAVDPNLDKYIYRMDYIVRANFNEVLDYTNTIMKYSPDYAEALTSDKLKFLEIVELNELIGSFLNTQRDIIQKNRIMFQILKEKHPEMFEKKGEVKAEEIKPKTKTKPKTKHEEKLLARR